MASRGDVADLPGVGEGGRERQSHERGDYIFHYGDVVSVLGISYSGDIEDTA